MSIASQRHGNVEVVAPSFPLAAEHLETFSAAVNRLFDDGRVRIVVNCENVSRIDSGGLECLLDASDKARRTGGALKLCTVNDLCRSILTATRLQAVFDLYDEPDEAVRSFL